MPQMLDKISRYEIAAILTQTQGLPLHVRRELMYRFALNHGENMSLVEEILYNEASYVEDVKAYREVQAKAWRDKLVQDKEDIERLKKEKRWDEKHNCEIPKPNTDDPQEKRFRHNAGSDKSVDVTWDSHTHGGPSPVSPSVVPAPSVHSSPDA